MPRKLKLKSSTPAKRTAANTEAAKPSTGKRGKAKAAQPAANVPAAPKSDRPKPTKLSGHRTETLLGNRYPYGKPSPHDDAYLAFYASVGCSDKASINLATLQRETPTNPYYAGSASNASSNLGYVNRLRKAGYLAADTDAHTIRFTDAKAFAYAKARLAALGKAKAS